MSTTTTDPFAADRSISHRVGVTLMNNQVGYVVAQVMEGKEELTQKARPL